MLATNAVPKMADFKGLIDIRDDCLAKADPYSKVLGLVVRIFPNEESCIRLIRALAAEVHEDWLEDHRYLNMVALKEQMKVPLLKAA